MLEIRWLHWIQSVALFCITLLWSDISHAGPMNGWPLSDASVPVNVLLKIKEITKVDAREGSFILYYHLAYWWRGAFEKQKTVEQYTGNEAKDFLKTIWSPRLDFINKAENTVILDQSVSIHQDGEIHVDQYGYVKLLVNYNFKDFPFDTQNFPILLASPDKRVEITTTQKALEFDNKTKLLSWHLKYFDHFVKQVPSMFDHAHVSQLKVLLVLKRDVLYYITKLYVPLLTFILITCAIFSYPDPHFRFKIPVLLTCLVLISLFSLRAFSEIPPVSYFTRLDHIVALSRVWLLLGFVYSLTVYLVRITRGEDAPQAFSQKQLIIRCCFPLCYIIFWLAAVLHGIFL